MCFLKKNIFSATFLLIISSTPYSFFGKIKYSINLIPIFWLQYILIIFKFLVKNDLLRDMKSFPIILLKNDSNLRLKKITINYINKNNNFSCLKLYKEKKDQFINPEIHSFNIIDDSADFLMPKIKSVFLYKKWKVLSSTNQIPYYSISNNVLPSKNILKSLISLIEKTISLDDKGCFKCLSHGDFAPWNIRENKKLQKKILIFDWEYAFDKSTIFYDFIYYILMTSHALGKNIPDSNKTKIIFNQYIRQISKIEIINLCDISIKYELTKTLKLIKKRAIYNNEYKFFSWLEDNEESILKLFQDICFSNKNF